MKKYYFNETMEDEISDLILIDRNAIVDKGMLLSALEMFIKYEENKVFNYRTDIIFGEKIIEFIDGEYVLLDELVKMHEGMADTLDTIYGMIIDGVFDSIESEECNE